MTKGLKPTSLVLAALGLFMLFSVLSEFREERFAALNARPPYSPESRLSSKDLSYAVSHSSGKNPITKIYASHLLSERNGSPAEAEKLLMSYVRSNPLDSEGYFLLGRARLKLGRSLDEAESLFKRALVLNPMSLPYNKALAEVYKKEGRFGEAVKYFEKALSIPANVQHSILANIYCDLAELHLEKGDDAGFSLYIESALETQSDNWRVHFLLFKSFLYANDMEMAFSHLGTAYSRARASVNRDESTGGFRSSFNSIIKELLVARDYSTVRKLYDRLALFSGEPEEVLTDLQERFGRNRKLTENIWGEKIHISLLDPMTSLKPSLLNGSNGCRAISIKRSVTAESNSETLEIRYESSSSYIDLWYVPLRVAVKSKRLSAEITLSSDAPIHDGQIAVELSGNLYYSRGLTKGEGPGRYRLSVESLLDYVGADLLLRPKDYNIFLTKVGLNTVCRSGKYTVEAINLYLGN